MKFDPIIAGFNVLFILGALQAAVALFNLIGVV